MAIAISRQQLFSRLSKLGLSEQAVRSYLPTWMTDEAIDSPSGLAHLKILLVRQFGLEANALFSADEATLFDRPRRVSFKRSVKLSEQQLTPAASIATSAARHVLSAAQFEYTAPPAPSAVRQWILQNGGDRVSLRGVLYFAVHHGIPVIPLRVLPETLPKMDGLVVSPMESPAIAVARNSPFQAWQAFIVAHELGHIHAGHVGPGRLLVEESFGEESFAANSKDEDEIVADRYALSLLGGNIDPAEDLFPGISNAADLARAAMDLQATRHVDAGHLILRHAYRTNNWRISIAALQRLDANPGAADQELTTAFLRAIDPTLLPSESLAFLETVTGIVIQRPEA